MNVRGVPPNRLIRREFAKRMTLLNVSGVERSRKALNEADFVLLILKPKRRVDGRRPPLIRNKRKDFKRIILLNKTDLPTKIDMDKVKRIQTDSEIVTTSMLKKEGIDQLEEKIADYFFQGANE